MPWHTFVRYKNLLAFFFFFFHGNSFVRINYRARSIVDREKTKRKKSIKNLLLLFAHCAHTGEFHLCAWNSIHESNIAARFMNMFTTLFIFFSFSFLPFSFLIIVPSCVFFDDLFTWYKSLDSFYKFAWYIIDTQVLSTSIVNQITK